MNVLIPGRHHLLTRFLQAYLQRLVQRPELAADLDGQPFADLRTERLIFAVTSANHSGTQRNPLAAHRREAAIEGLSGTFDCDTLVFPIHDVGMTDRFAEFVLKTIEAASFGRHTLTPSNTVVACSTPEVIAMYEGLGFRIAPVELRARDVASTKARRPWEVLSELASADEKHWKSSPARQEVAPASMRLLDKYDAGQQLRDIFSQSTLTEDGDLTGTRDYNVYVRSFDEGADRKAALCQEYIVPGRIVDIGCCTGALVEKLTHDDRLRESDFYGVEVARTLFAECMHRKAQGAFANDNVFFYQRDFTAKSLFADASLHTVLSFSLTHEVESYSGRDALRRFMELVYQQLAPGGRWINVDVVGPEDADEEVAMWLRRDDGTNDGWDTPFVSDARGADRAYLETLSTLARFKRFALDFQPDTEGTVPYRIEDIDGEPHVLLTLRDACEFLSKKDYLDNWRSEMHERFCFFSQSDWHEAVREAGFTVHRDSHQFTNPWIVENRWQGSSRLFEVEAGALVPLPYPPTTVVVIAEKPPS